MIWHCIYHSHSPTFIQSKLHLDFMAKKNPLKFNPLGKMQTCTWSSQIFIKTLTPNFTPFPKLKMYSFLWIYKISLFIPVFHQRIFKRCKLICDGSQLVNGAYHWQRDNTIKHMILLILNLAMICVCSTSCLVNWPWLIRNGGVLVDSSTI